MNKNKSNSMFSNKNECSLCGELTPVYERKQSGQYLCTDCFVESIERIVSKTISLFNMLQPDDHIIVGLSGGKDSAVLLTLLDKIQKQTYNASPIIALTIDEGIKNYRSKNIEKASSLCKTLNIAHKVISFKGVIGRSLDEIIEQKRYDEDFRYPCNYCAIIRRRLLNDFAKELGGSVLALGHNLTDISETFLMNIFYKRFHLIGRQYLMNKSKSDFYVKKVMPLMKIPEYEIELYAKIKNFEYDENLCPYRLGFPIMRKKVLHFIENLRKTSPEIEYNLFNGFLEMSEILHKNYGKVKKNFCSTCGYPTSNEHLCSFCKITKT